MTDSARIAAQLGAVRQRIERAARAAGRNPSAIRLVVVGKTFPAADVAAAIRAGATDVGENRVQEAAAKRPDVDVAARWHLIGHLQSNKARKAVEVFDVIESVDSFELAERLARHALELGRAPLSILLQVHLGSEDTKAGLSPAALTSTAQRVAELPGLRLDGLMAIPPPSADPEAVTPWVAELSRLLELVRGRLPPAAAASWRELSIGMSHDYEAAIRAGATIVRVGSAIFGARVG